MHFKRTPFLTRAEKRQLVESATRTPEGCLIHSGREGVTIRGEVYSPARLMWAEANCYTSDAERALNTHEVIHVPTCPNTGDIFPLCIEPSHLMLGDSSMKTSNQRSRGRGKPTCAHGLEDRNIHGACRICNRAAVRRYKNKEVSL